MLNALSISILGANKDGALRAISSLEHQGFVLTSCFDWKGGVLNTWAHPSQSSVENCSVQTRAGIACCVGPMWYRGQYGRKALSLLLNEIGASIPIDEMELRGNFALFIRNNNKCLLMNDSLGFVRIYISSDGLFCSTSWLATCSYEGRVEIDEVSACEYVLLGASHSEKTVARGVITLSLGHAYDLMLKRQYARFPTDIWAGYQVPRSFDEAGNEAYDYLHAVFMEITTAFLDLIRSALSGGFDSRLIVAGLLACGIHPKLFVYGSDKSKDVLIAQAVADSEGISLSNIDKDILKRRLPLPDIECLVHNALFFDGLPNDGIYDPGVDQQTRLEQNAGGYLALNGGGGEIFRNFFHLPDRPYYAADIVRTFYRGFDPAVFRHRYGLSNYQDNLVSSIEHSLGMNNTTTNRMFKRGQVELIYPLFRCHHWMSVNNSVAVRHGYYATPLVDLKSVRMSHLLPVSWKNAGRFESHLISKLHNGIASQASVYGFCFADGPNWRARFMEWATCKRPVFARPLINATRRSLHKIEVPSDMIAHCRSLLPGEWQLDHVLNLRHLPDTNAVARALAVEIVWRDIFS